MDKMVKLEFYRGKNVFITGHSGFKGSWLSRILTLFGANVTGYSLPPSTDPSLFRLLDTSDETISVTADIRDLEKLKTTLKASHADIVFHLAAQPLVRDSYQDPVTTYTTNVIGTVNLLEACRGVKSVKSIINVTTDKVYENKEWAWGYRENETLCGCDPYSNSKSCSELVTYSYKKSFYNLPESPSISTARSGNVIGGGDFSANRIIPDCVRAALSHHDIVIRNPNSTRPYQHVLDCLCGYLTLAEKQYHNGELSGSYNFGPDEADCITTAFLAERFCKLWKDGSCWINRPDGGPHEAHFLKLDCAKAKADLGWHPTWDINAALQKTVEWYRVYANQGDLKAITEKQIKEFFKI